MARILRYDRSRRRAPPDPRGRLKIRAPQSRKRRRVGVLHPITTMMLLVFCGTLWALNAPPGLTPTGLAHQFGWPVDAKPAEDWPAATGTPTAATDSISAQFALCHSGGGYNCVVDGDTFWLRGEKIRVADIDTPETHPARCASEAALGQRATLRLHALLNAGPFTLAPTVDGRTHDHYGRRLAVVQRGGQSLGAVMASEGLARSYAGGPRQPWC